MSHRHRHSCDYPGYVDEYERWVGSLSPEDREELKRRGVDHPDPPSYRANVRDGDLADSPLAAFTPDMAGAVDGGAAFESADTQARSDVLASFCARMRGCANPALVFDAVCYATGVLAIEGQSATELAARHGVTKQAFSKIAVEWCATFGLPPARAMKSKRARAAYRERARKVHGRRKLTRPPEG